jgi:hypothetical protein
MMTPAETARLASNLSSLEAFLDGGFSGTLRVKLAGASPDGSDVDFTITHLTGGISVRGARRGDRHALPPLVADGTASQMRGGGGGASTVSHDPSRMIHNRHVSQGAACYAEGDQRVAVDVEKHCRRYIDEQRYDTTNVPRSHWHIPVPKISAYPRTNKKVDQDRYHNH